ncbi:MAG: hypothetical protein RL755_66 [Pseudomonadota bacterium]|jgi:hypothetical protein
MKPADLIRLSGVSKQTLHNWKKNKPVLYEVVRLGCEVKLQQEPQLQDNWYECKTLDNTQIT